MKKRLALLSITVFVYASSCCAQVNVLPKPTAALDTNILTLGDQTKLHLSIQVPLFSKVKFPNLKDTLLSKIEIVEISKVDTIVSEDKNSFTLSQHYTITGFDSGYYAVPPFQFFVNNDSVYTDAFLIQVNNVPVDTTLAIKDVKAPLDLPITLKELLPYIGGTVLLAIILYLLYRYWQKRKIKPLVQPEEKKIIIPAHIIALEALNHLQQEKLWQHGLMKEYHIRLSDIIRAYIEARFHIFALEQTTDEIIKSMRSIDIEDAMKIKLKQLLVLSDLVKFAKEQPLPNENENSLLMAYEFVNTTLQKQTPIEEDGKEEPTP